MRTTVTVSFRFDATHRWPAAPEMTPSVAFLAHDHRHEFHVRAWRAVTHDDREVEIILLKRAMAAWVDDRWHGDLGTLSCEMVATLLVAEFDLVACEVLEDGENGARVDA